MSPQDTPSVDTAALEKASNALSECLFSQYAFTVAGVAGGTGYAIYRKPPNGLGLMLVAGAAGTMADFAYSWTIGCRPQVDAWQRLRELTKHDK